MNVPVDQRTLSFSLSHACGLVACTLAAGMPVGIDVEPIDGAQTTDIAERFFSPSEVVTLRECPEDVRRIRFIELSPKREDSSLRCSNLSRHPARRGRED